MMFGWFSGIFSKSMRSHILGDYFWKDRMNCSVCLELLPTDLPFQLLNLPFEERFG